MNHLALLSAVLGVALTNGAWLHYLSLIPKGAVPQRPTGHALAMAVGMLAAIGGLVIAPLLGQGISLTAILLAPLSLGMGGFFFWLLPQASLPKGDLRLAVDEPLLPFSAWDHQSKPFDSSSLAGQRVLLKVFRGHW